MKEKGKKGVAFTFEDGSEIGIEIEKISDERICSETRGVTGDYSCKFEGKTEQGRKVNWPFDKY